MSEQHKNIVRNYYEVATGKHLDFTEIVTAGFVDHHFPPDLPPGPEGVKKFFAEVLGGIFSEMKFEFDDIIAGEDKVVCRFALRAVHTGAFGAIAPTNREILCPAISIFRVEGDKLAEGWEVADIAGLIQQLS